MSNTENIVNRSAKIIQHLLKDDGIFPNSMFPLLVYKNVIMVAGIKHPQIFEDIFKLNDWKNGWRNGIYNYHHYHSITHEALGVYSGKCHVLMGGDEGVEFDIAKGDVMVIPAGVAHKSLGSSEDFKCIGAYPHGHDFDMNYGKAGERPKADRSIGNVPIPAADPVFGKNGPLISCWLKGPA